MIAALLADVPDAMSPEEAILTRVEQLKAEARQYGWDGPPFQMDVLASFCGLHVREVSNLPGGSDACIAGDAVLIRAGAPPRRVRFSIAHEIAHTLFPPVPVSADLSPFRTYRHDAESPVEQLCQLAAGELLMPMEEVALRLPRSALSTDVIRELADCFDVSLEALIRKLPLVSEGDVLAVFLALAHKPSERLLLEQTDLLGSATPATKLRIVSVGGTHTGPMPYMPRHKSVPSDSVAYTVLRTGVAASAREDWSTVGQLSECLVHAFPMGPVAHADIACAIEVRGGFAAGERHST